MNRDEVIKSLTPHTLGYLIAIDIVKKRKWQMGHKDPSWYYSSHRQPSGTEGSRYDQELLREGLVVEIWVKDHWELVITEKGSALLDSLSNLEKAWIIVENKFVGFAWEVVMELSLEELPLFFGIDWITPSGAAYAAQEAAITRYRQLMGLPPRKRPEGVPGSSSSSSSVSSSSSSSVGLVTATILVHHQFRGLKNDSRNSKMANRQT